MAEEKIDKRKGRTTAVPGSGRKMKQADWPSIERDYCEGVLSLRAMEQKYGISDSVIRGHCLREGLTREVMPKARTKAEAMVAAHDVAAVKEMRETGAVPEGIAQKLEEAQHNAEELAAESAAALQFKVRMQHRSDIEIARGVTMDLLQELRSVTQGKDAIDKLIDELREGGASAADVLQKVVSLPGRSTAAQKLVASLEKLIQMERTAYGIDKTLSEETSIDVLIKRLAQEP